MTDKVRDFFEKVSADEALRAELEAAVKGVENAEQIPTILNFAEKHGFELSKEDLAQDNADIDLDELETVTGGGGCGCPVIGYGSGDDLGCMCGFLGTGGVGKDAAPSSQGGCSCVVGGAGATNRH